MCPEKAILSAYQDGELEGRHQQTVEEHINACEKCRKTMAELKAVRSVLHREEDLPLLRNKEYIKTRVFEYTAIKNRRRFWKRGLTLPVPLAATALALVFFLIGGITFLTINRNNAPVVAEQVNSRAIEIQAEELALLRKLMESDGVIVEVNMQLPEQREIKIIGEPQILTQKQMVNFKK